MGFKGALKSGLGKIGQLTGLTDATTKPQTINAPKGQSMEQLQAQGRASAGMAAADKAGEAKKAAKAATMQTSGNKLAAATNAASAAGDAASQGYAETANQMTNLAANQDQANLNRQTQVDQFNSNLKENRYQQQKNRQQQTLSSAMGMIGGIVGGSKKSSDENKKTVKHTYIPKEERIGVNR